MTKDEWYDNLEIKNQLNVDNTALLRVQSPNGVYLNVSAKDGMTTLDPSLLHLFGSLYTENDIYINGSITSTTDFEHGKQAGGGALLLSHGWEGSGDQSNPIAVTPPELRLITSGSPIKNGSSLPSTGMNNQPGQVFYHTPQGGPNRLYIWTGSSWSASATNASAYYDTLFLFKSDGYSPAHLRLDKLYANRVASTNGTNIYFDNAAVFDNNVTFSIDLTVAGTANCNNDYVLSPSSYAIHLHHTTHNIGGYTVGALQVQDGNGTLATLDASNVLVDHLFNASGGGIYVMDTLKCSGIIQVAGAVSETSVGTDNVRIGVAGGTPRIVFEDSGYTQWEIDNDEGAMRFFNPGTARFEMSTDAFYPTESTLKYCGLSDHAWAGVYTEISYYHVPWTSWDALDDLGLARNLQTVKEKRKTPEGEEYEVDVISRESAKFLEDKDGYYRSCDAGGYLLSCIKALVLRLEEAEAEITKLKGENA